MLDKSGYYFAHDSNHSKKVGGMEWSILEWTGQCLLAPGNELEIRIEGYDEFRYIELPPSKENV